MTVVLCGGVVCHTKDTDPGPCDDKVVDGLGGCLCIAQVVILDVDHMRLDLLVGLVRGSTLGSTHLWIVVYGCEGADVTILG
jgi:hypothetical protein